MSRHHFATLSILLAVLVSPGSAQDANTGASPSPTPAPSATPEVGNPDGSDQADQGLIRRSLRSFLRDDDQGSGKGIHAGPFLPRVVVLSSGGGPGPLLHLWLPHVGGGPIDVHASAAYSIYKYQYYDMQVGLIPHKGERLPNVETGTTALFPLADVEKTSGTQGFNAYVSARYRDYPREDFFGIGPTTSRDAHSDYRLKDGLYEGIIRFQKSRLSVMGRAGLLKTSILPGEDSAYVDTVSLYSPITAPGVESSPDFIHASIGAWLDLRDEPGNPHKGAAFGAAYARFDQHNGDAFGFTRFSAEAREYLPLASHRHVLAFRQELSLDSPTGGRQIPFYLQSTLGGGTLLQGYASSRFRDDRLLYLIAEYRFEVTPKVELALLYEGGKVFPQSEGVNFHDLRRSWGGGIRLKSPRKVHVRLDVVRSQDEGTRVHLKLGRSF